MLWQFVSQRVQVVRSRPDSRAGDRPGLECAELMDAGAWDSAGLELTGRHPTGPRVQSRRRRSKPRFPLMESRLEPRILLRCAAERSSRRRFAHAIRSRMQRRV